MTDNLGRLTRISGVLAWASPRNSVRSPFLDSYRVVHNPQPPGARWCSRVESKRRGVLKSQIRATLCGLGLQHF
jgi:hypothetical protein